ncbi:chemotaxis protein CheB [Microcoleus sp. FACHB-1515]|uniref:chemotaxis protein CheB n=1 Tax=Cyanophyceae TaxID=3028117 RepID=UPI001682EA1B|nr:chemotaxis protein CheB [Microcoleus sp. FACHB-1515]MBD2088534.1 chemotaxis protein CheB [Microcoleus sp. FACHB-1515]
MTVKLVVIGASLGGFSALKLILGKLPPAFSVPIAIVQHRHKESQTTLASYLQPLIPLPIREVEDKDEIAPGTIYLAPADYHLLVEFGYFTLTTDEPVCYARPSIDVLFESAADAYGDRVIGIILTGANQDGAQGAAAIKTKGGRVIVQDPSTAESPVMPDAAIAATQVDAIVPLTAIASTLLTYL